MSKKDKLLGMPHGTANNQLRKLILWKLVLETEKDNCFRCGYRIESVEHLSIEHKESWQRADDPRASFFDLGNIAFSHLSCNIGAPRSDENHCLAGHLRSEQNTYLRPDGERVCKLCRRSRDRERWYAQGKAEKRRIRRGLVRRSRVAQLVD